MNANSEDEYTKRWIHWTIEAEVQLDTEARNQHLWPLRNLYGKSSSSCLTIRKRQAVNELPEHERYRKDTISSNILDEIK